MRRLLTIILCIILITSTIPYKVQAEENVGSTDKIEQKIEEESNKKYLNRAEIITVTNSHTVNTVIKSYKFHYSAGHAFAAEQGNNLIDRLKWNNALVVGDNNIKNGPDRYILNRDGSVKYMIQDKYYSTAKNSVNACFDDTTGMLKYLDADGNPMVIEVPKDQYLEAVEEMKKKILEGKVPGITDPKEAENLVKEGHLTYVQAKNLAKPLTKESLLFDATNGVISAGVGFGISSVLTYAVLRFQGENRGEAIKKSAIEGLKTGGNVFAISVIAGQLIKSKAVDLFKPTSEALMKALGKDFAEKLLKTFGVEVLDKGTEEVTKQAARLLRTQVLVAAVTTVVFTVPDFVDLLRSRISVAQFIKNLITTVGSLATGTGGFLLGAQLGSLINPGIGSAIGGLIGGILGGLGGAAGINWVASKVVEDDAQKMYNILEERFTVYCDDYLVNETETTNILTKLSEKMDKSFYKDMYQSEDKVAFIDNILEPLFEEEIMKRSQLDVPSEQEMRLALKSQLKEIVFIH